MSSLTPSELEPMKNKEIKILLRETSTQTLLELLPVELTGTSEEYLGENIDTVRNHNAIVVVYNPSGAFSDFLQPI